MKTAILTDTTFYVEHEYITEHNIFRIPLMVNFENVTYKESDTDDTILKSIMQKIGDDKVLPKTSQPATQDFLDKFEEIKNLGYERILVFTLSSFLSGTYQGAVLAANTFNEVNGDFVEVYDSKNAAMGSMFSVREVVRYMDEIDEDIEAQKVQSIVDFYAEEAKVYLAVDTLDYLIYGGRISGTVGAGLNLVGIRPLLRLEAGKIEAYAKIRSSKKVLKRIVDDYSAAELSTGYLAIGHCAAEKDAKSLMKHMGNMKANVTTMPMVEVGPVVGMHAGPGAIAVVWAPHYF